MLDDVEELFGMKDSEKPIGIGRGPAVELEIVVVFRTGTAVLLAESLRVELAHALGLRRDAEAAVVAEVTAQRCSLTADQIEAVLVAPTAADDADLVALTARSDRIREEVTSVRPTRHE